MMVLLKMDADVFQGGTGPRRFGSERGVVARDERACGVSVPLPCPIC